jgi:hypothetical protein
MFLTPKKIKDIAKIIMDHHEAVAAALYGKEAVSDEGWKLALGLDLVDPKATADELSSQIHVFGAFMAHVDHASQFTRYGTTALDFIDEIQRNPIPMTFVEHLAAKKSAQRSAQYIVGLGNKIGATVGSSLIEADRRLDQQMRSTIRDVVSARFGDNDAAKRMKQRGIVRGKEADFFDESFRSTRQRMVSDMGHATGDWARDFKRIAKTETQRAFESGQVESWHEQEKEAAKELKRPVEKVIVYKIPRPDACRHCLRLHRDPGGNLRLFLLDQLEGNGVNVGRKAAEWKAVVGPIHPFCACQIVRLPKYLDLPKGWKSGRSAPNLIGPSGMMVIEDEEAVA